MTATILSRVPGCAPDAWSPEYALPERELLPAEHAWSDIMDPKAAAQLLEVVVQLGDVRRSYAGRPRSEVFRCWCAAVRRSR